MRLQNKQSAKSIPRWLPFTFLATSAAGFLDAVYLTVSHYRSLPVVCSAIFGCEEVLSSQYAILFGIPAALLGAWYYLLILLLTIAYLDAGKVGILRIAAYLTPIGLVASLWFLFLQAFVIKAYCIYCLFSTLTSTLLFVFGAYMFWLEWNEMRRKCYQCKECGLQYEEKAWAEKCEIWCKEHKSCNLEIMRHAIENK